MDFEEALGNVNEEVKEEFKEEVNVKNEEPVFTISVKQEEKPNQKTFNVYMDNDLVKELDKIAKKTKRSRNEVVNMMCEWCLKNIDIK